MKARKLSEIAFSRTIDIKEILVFEKIRETLQLQHQNIKTRNGAVAQCLKCSLRSYMGSGSYPSCSIPLPALCLWPGKVAKDDPKPWHLASAWKIWKNLLAPGFGLARLQPVRPLRKSTSGWKIILSVYPSVCSSGFPIETISQGSKKRKTIERNWICVQI